MFDRFRPDGNDDSHWVGRLLEECALLLALVRGVVVAANERAAALQTAAETADDRQMRDAYLRDRQAAQALADRLADYKVAFYRLAKQVSTTVERARHGDTTARRKLETYHEVVAHERNKLYDETLDHLHGAGARLAEREADRYLSRAQEGGLEESQADEHSAASELVDDPMRQIIDQIDEAIDADRDRTTDGDLSDRTDSNDDSDAPETLTVSND